MTNQMAKTQTKGQISFATYMTSNAVSTKVNEIIGDKREGAKFISSIVSAVQANPALKECTNASILSAALELHALNLSPSPRLGQAYLIPFKNNKLGVSEVQLQIGYKALIQLAIRSGQYTKLNVVEIKDGELIKYDPLTEEIEVKIMENEIEREHAKTIGYYAFFEYKNGFRKALYWSQEKMLLHADRYSKSFKAADFKKIEEGKIPASDMWKYSSPWYTSFDKMAKKTMIKQLLNGWGVLSTEMEDALDKDSAVIGEDSVSYVEEMEDIPTTTQEEVKEAIVKETKSLDDFE